MTVASHVWLRAQPQLTPERSAVRLALLGLGQVGSAVARLLHEQPALGQRFVIDGALVRDAARSRGPEAAGIPLTTDGTTLLIGETGVVVEALGGLEPARSLLLAALERGLPVVTANKSLVAAHGDELLAAARLSGAPLYYEATVIAGVPFLGPLGRRLLAGEVTALTGIVNGTSNYILTRMAAERGSFADVLADAQACGYAEPDPASDVRGIDAVEKLCVLLRHFGSWSIRPSAIETTGIDGLIAQDLEHARWFGGCIRPIVCADWRDGVPEAFAGPAFVDDRNAFARVDGVRNAIALHSRWSGELFFSGPGAGPTVTAATLLDDASEAAMTIAAVERAPARPVDACDAPITEWFLRVRAPRVPETATLADLLAARGLSVRRTSALDTRTGVECQWFLIRACRRTAIDEGIAALAAHGCGGYAIRALV
jgi:homoserine dehydrogenase